MKTNYNLHDESALIGYTCYCGKGFIGDGINECDLKFSEILLIGGNNYLTSMSIYSSKSEVAMG